MPSGAFSKRADWFSAKLNNNYADSVIGGALSTAPAGLSANQGQATQPGDRIIFNPADALFWSNNNVGNLYTGTYRYVAMRNNSVSTPERGRAAFWDISPFTGANNIGTTAADSLYQVTSDEAANIGVSLMAGVYINNQAVNNTQNWYWWIQESGKASVRFVGNNGNTAYGSGANNTLTAPLDGGGVYLAGAGNANNQLTVGLFITSGNANATTNAVIDTMFTRYSGVAEVTPSNGNISLVDLTLSRASFRW